MGTLIGLLAAQGLSERVARLIAYAGLVLLLLGTFAGLKVAYDRHIIGVSNAKQAASNTKADRKADEHAVVRQRSDDSRRAQEADQLSKVQANAKTDHDRSIARFHCIFLQQDARARNRQPPDCLAADMRSRANGAQ